MPKGPEQCTPPEAKIETQKSELKKRYELLGCIRGEKFHSLYTKIDDYLGSSNVYNTFVTVEQLRMAVAISRHPVVEDILEKIKRGEVTRDNFDPELLREASVLQSMKILDLGCGPKPTFARTARELGADVYTVDTIPARIFNFLEKFGDIKRLEEEKHVQVDINDPNAGTIIAQKTNGNFDLVTASTVLGDYLDDFPTDLEMSGIRRRTRTPSDRRLEELGMELLKQEGVFHRPPESPRLKSEIKG